MSSSSSPPAWNLQAKLWQKDLSPSTPFRNHHDYEKEDFKPRLNNNNTNNVALSSIHTNENQQNPGLAQGDNNNNVQINIQQPSAAQFASTNNTNGETPSRELIGENNTTNDQEETTNNNNNLNISQHEVAATTIYSGRSQYNHDVEESSAMLIEAAAVVDEYSPDRGSLRCVRRRAEALRSEKQAQQDPNTNPNQSVFSNKTTASSSHHSHGLESVKSPYRLHAIVSQKELNKRKRVDSHATSSSMLGGSRISTKMTDRDVAAYHASSKTSQKLDKEPEVLLSETVIAARGGLTPEEQINKQVNRFVEKLMNASERESENAMLPPQSKAKYAVPFASPVSARQNGSNHNSSFSTPNKSSNNNNNTSSSSTMTPSSVASASPASSIKRKGGLAKKLLDEQEHHIVDALATIMMTKANPPSYEELQGNTESDVPSRNSAFSFALSADDKHILLTALKFTLSGELYTSEAEFSRIIGFSRAQGQKVLKALATTFDHWNKLCYDHGGEWTMIKRCLAAVSETPVNWTAKTHTTRSVHFGTVTQRDLEGLLARLRNDEAKKVPRSKLVVERHRNRMA